MFDYLIVGQGLAGSMLAYELLKQKQTVFIIDQGSGINASRQAIGLINPITGRRFVKSWKTDELLPYLKKYYTNLENELNTNFFNETKIIKVLQSIEQLNDLSIRFEDENYQKYLGYDFIEISPTINNPLKSVAFNPAYQIDAAALQNAFVQFFNEKRLSKQDWFEHEKLKINEQSVTYKGLEAKNILFAEGYLMRNNPFFNHLPIQYSKGEVLIIESKELQVMEHISSHVSITPIGNNTYYVGSTYDWNDHTISPTKGKYSYLVDGLNESINVPYTIKEIKAGIRPTVKDRRPLLGVHPNHSNMYVFNGFGTKGLSLGPYFANEFVHFLLNKKELDKEYNITRF